MKDADAAVPARLGALAAEDLLSRKGFMLYESEGVRAMHYAEACAAMGALRLAGRIADRDLIDRIVKRYAKAHSGLEVPNTANHVDANVYGILPLEIYLLTGDEACRARGRELADGQWKDPLPDGISAQARYWIDDVYMIAVLQAQAYRATREEAYVDRAALVVEAYLRKLQEGNGLFRHGPRAPFYWGRGNGWVAAGLAELLVSLPPAHPRYAPIRDGYLIMMEALGRCQAPSGMWRQLLDREEAWEESSCTAMFGFALSVGVRLGLLDPGDSGRRCDAAWRALSARVDRAGRLAGVCAGTGQGADAAYYLDRPRVSGDLHGQAALLWFAAERL